MREPGGVIPMQIPEAAAALVGRCMRKHAALFFVLKRSVLFIPAHSPSEQEGI